MLNLASVFKNHYHNDALVYNPYFILYSFSNYPSLKCPRGIQLEYKTFVKEHIFAPIFFLFNPVIGLTYQLILTKHMQDTIEFLPKFLCTSHIPLNARDSKREAFYSPISCYFKLR